MARLKIIFISVVLLGFCLAQEPWQAYGPQVPNYQINDVSILQFLDGNYYIYAVGYDVQNHNGLILRFNAPNWDRYPTSYDHDYIYTSIVEGWPGYHLIVGYKNTEPNKYKGLVLRCVFSEPPYINIEDITDSLPPPYDSATPPILSASWAGQTEKIMITGGYGLILFSSNHGNSWYPPQNHPNPDPEARLSDWYNSSRWYDETYPYQAGPVMVCADNSGIVARSTDEGTTWNVGFPDPEPYDIPLYGTYYGRVLPLDVTTNFCAMADGYVGKWSSSSWQFRRIPDLPWITDPIHGNKRWFWFHSCQYTYHMYDPPYVNWYHVVGSDGCIAQIPPNILDTLNYWWERHPRNDSFYTLNVVEHGLYGGWEDVDPVAHAFGSKGQSLVHFYTGVILDPTPIPTAQTPEVCQNLTMVYNGTYGGYDLYWDPPSNYENAKVGGYWICPPEGARWIANFAPVPRTTYFIPWPTRQYLNARVIAMRRDGLCGPWTDLVWKCTIDAQVNRSATGISNGARNLLLDNQGRLWAFYGKGGNIYATYTTNNGDNWTTSVNIGEGDMQAGAINANGNPVVILIKNIQPPPPSVWRIGQLYVTHLTSEGWSVPQLVREKYPVLSWYNPAVVVDKYNKVHLVYEESNPRIAHQWSLNYGEFPLDNPQQSNWQELDWWGYEIPPHPPASASISLDSKNCPHVIWGTPFSDTIRYAFLDTVGLWCKTRFVAHGYSPCLEMNGDIASVVYTYENGVWYITGGKGGFSTPKRIHQSTGYTRHPVIKNNYVVWEEQIGDMTDLWYSYLQYIPYDFTWTQAQKLFGYPYLDDRLPQIEWQRSYLCAVWTQGLDPKYTVPFERKEFPISPPYQAIDLGHEAPSPITVERDGYIEYGPEAYKTVDFDSNKLVYHITGLEGSDKWTIKFILYHEGADKWKERIRIDDGWTRNKWVYPYQVTEIEGIIPEAFLMDGEITVTVEVTQGELAVLSAIVLEREPKGQGGGPQSLTVKEIPSNFTLDCFPNPSRNRTLITYTLPYPCEVKLAVYNSLGQLIQIIEHSRQSAGVYSVNWDNDAANNKNITSGVYFIRLETPEMTVVRKLVVLE